MSLFCHRPAAQDSCIGQKVGKAVLGRESNHTLRGLLSRAYFPPILTQHDDKVLSKSQVKGMGQLLSRRERFVAPLESLVRIAELPQSPGRVREVMYPGISPGIAEDERPMALSIIEGDYVFETFPGSEELAHPVQGTS